MPVAGILKLFTFVLPCTLQGGESADKLSHEDYLNAKVGCCHNASRLQQTAEGTNRLQGIHT